MNAPENLGDILFKLQTSGYRPILAHPERYPFWYNDFEQYERDTQPSGHVDLSQPSHQTEDMPPGQHPQHAPGSQQWTRHSLRVQYDAA